MESREERQKVHPLRHVSESRGNGLGFSVVVEHFLAIRDPTRTACNHQTGATHRTRCAVDPNRTRTNTACSLCAVPPFRVTRWQPGHRWNRSPALRSGPGRRRRNGCAHTTGPKISSWITFMSDVVFSINCRCDEVAQIAYPVATGRDVRPSPPSVLDIAGDARELLVGHQRSHVRRRIETSTDLDLSGNIGNAGGDAVVDRLVGVEAGSGAAALTVIEEDCVAAPVMAISRSASARIIAGDLPPSSRDTFFRLPRPHARSACRLRSNR